MNYLMNLKRIVLVAGIIIGVLSTVIVSASCTQKPETISYGSSGSAPFWLPITEERNLFSSNTIQINAKNYDTGAKLQEAVASGEVDLALLSEYALLNQILQKKDLSSIAVVQKSEFLVIIARQADGIAGIANLKGKRIGLARGTISEFYLGRTLNLNGVNIQDVTLVNLSQAQVGDALAKGEVNAALVYRVSTPQIQERVAETAVWPAQSGQPVFTMLVGRTDWITQHADLVKRLLKAIDQANNYITGHVSETDSILRQHGFDAATISNERSQTHYSLSLDQALITAMEDEARWMIKNNLTPEKQVPFFNDYIYEDALKAIKPEAVNIIR